GPARAASTAQADAAPNGPASAASTAQGVRVAKPPLAATKEPQEMRRVPRRGREATEQGDPMTRSPDGIRTRATALRGRRARPLHNGADRYYQLRWSA